MKSQYKRIFFLGLTAVSLLASAQNSPRVAEFDESWIANQHVLGVNKEDGHATMMPYATRAALLADPRYDRAWLMPERAEWLDLNGTWKFKWVAGTPEGPGESEFQAADYDDTAWGTIQVPMSWEMQEGTNLPIYTNIGYPFVIEPPRAMTGVREHGVDGDNAVGFYRRTFTMPEHWGDKRVYIHFDGVYAAPVVWVNGKFVGYSQGANNVAEFDLTDFLQPGENQLSVRVYRWCDGSYLEGQDMWRLSGIHRDVYLYATPRTAIRDHYITTLDQSADATSGRLNVAMKIDNRDGKPSTKEVRLELRDANGKPVSSANQTVAVTGKSADVALTTPMLGGLHPWHPENPYLYDVVISQYDENGNEEMAFATKYGFRNIQAVNEGDNHHYTVNGKRVYLKGTNIHDTHPLYGRYVPEETMLEDINLMKQANINTVRTSHYPRHEKMYAMFDAYGLFVVDEADMECHAAQGLTQDPEWTDAFVDRNVRMVMRDRNHPSVLFWSTGNENGEGENLKHCYDAVRALDSRPIHSHGTEYSDMQSEMYATIDQTIELQKGWEGKPFFMCEYAHAMGQAIGNLQEYWDVMEAPESTGCVGACVWDWVDQAIYDPKYLAKGDTITADGYHRWIGGCDYDPFFETKATCDKGYQGNFLNNGIITPDRKWTAKLTEVKKVYQNAVFSDFDGKSVKVRNKYNHSDLGDLFYLTYTILKDGKEIENGIADISVAPGATETVALPIKSQTSQDGEYTAIIGLNLKQAQPWAQRGYRLADEQFVMNQRPALPRVNAKGALKVEGNKVSGKDFTIEFDDNGALKSYIYRGKELIAKAPEYNDYRRIDNDMNGHQFDESIDAWGGGTYNYADNGITSHRVTMPLKKRGGNATLAMAAEGEKSNYSVEYTVYPNGQLDMQVTFDPQRRGLRRLGLGMQFAPGFEHVEYYAKGPWSNYTDRQRGSYLQHVSTTMRDMVDENTHPQTYGDHQGLRQVTLFNENGAGLKIETEGQVSFSLSHYDELEWNHKLPYVKLHWEDLQKHPETFAHFDYWTRGIGNFSCGGDHCLPQYETPYPDNYQGAESLSYKLRFTPF